MHATFFEETKITLRFRNILEIKDFKTVLAILHCGDNGENLLEKLNKHIGINENNFNEKFVQFLKK